MERDINEAELRLGEPVSRRHRPAKGPLSRDAIVQAALTLISQRGASVVKLGDIARALDTGPSSLYVYFTNRDALMEHALDAAYRQVLLPDPQVVPWREGLTQCLLQTMNTLGRYPGLAMTALGTAPVLPGALRIAEVELTLLRLAGLTDQRAALAVDLIALFTAAGALEGERGSDEHQRMTHESTRAAYAAADPEHFPTVALLAEALTAADTPTRREFAVQVLLDGLTAPMG